MRTIIANLMTLSLVSYGSAMAATAGTVRYRVVLQETELRPTLEVAEALVGTYGGEMLRDIDAGPRSFVVAMTEQRANLLRQSRAVASVETFSSTAGHTQHLVSNAEVDLGAFVYDGSGNLGSIGGDVFRYDRIGRIKTATVSSVQQTFTYDGFGNLTAIGTPAGAVCAGNVVCGRAIAVSAATNRITSNGAHYTEAGGLDALDGLTYNYDDVGMMTGVSTGAAISRQFIYTAADERLATYLPSGVWNWTVRDTNGAVLRELTSQDSGSAIGAANWTWSEDYVYRGPLLLAAITPQGRRHFHLDHLGSPRVITNDDGLKIGMHKYLPFGAELATATSETPQDARKFTGHERDGVNDANALDYMHARYYASAMGRFLSVDPAIGNPAVPQSWNRYAYVTNSPITRLDPDGRDEYYFAWRSTSTDVGHAAIAIENRDRSGRLTGTLTVRHLWPHDGGEARKLDKTFVARADYRVEIVPQAKLMDVDGGEGRPADGIVRIKGDATQDAAVTSALAATAAANPLYVGPLNTCSTYAATGVAATGITPTERGTVTVMTGRLFLPQVVWIRVITPVGVYMSLAKSADTRVQVVKPIAEPKADITVTKQ